MNALTTNNATTAHSRHATESKKCGGQALLPVLRSNLASESASPLLLRTDVVRPAVLARGPSAERVRRIEMLTVVDAHSEAVSQLAAWPSGAEGVRRGDN